MTNPEADTLIATLPKPGGLRLYRKGDEIVMEGGRSGGHSIHTSVSSAERLLLHWKGYVESNNQTLGPGYSPTQPTAASAPHGPAIGAWVSFPSKSSPTGWRKGQVVKVTGKRVLIAFQFKYEKESARRSGEKFDPSKANTTWRKLTEIKFR